VKLPVPVAETHAVGVATDSGLCPAVPTTFVTECDNAPEPSKDDS
jgi:hypothetical protein